MQQRQHGRRRAAGRGSPSRGALVAHHGGELLVAHFAVAVEVRLADHLVNLLLTQVLAQGRHHLQVLNETILTRVSL